MVYVDEDLMCMGCFVGFGMVVGGSWEGLSGSLKEYLGERGF